MRLPTLDQLDRFGIDAFKVLDKIETDLETALDAADSKRDRIRIEKAIERFEKRRDEFVGVN